MEYINKAASVIRHKDLNWQKEAVSLLQDAENTQWGLSAFKDNPEYNDLKAKLSNTTTKAGISEWIDEFKKFKNTYNNLVEECNSKTEALNKALDETYIPHVLITDAGLTEFHGVPTNTCLGIGPYEAEEIDKFTGNLPLL